jgi:putative ABC transport system permease protein
VRFATQRSPRRSGTDLARGQLATGYIAWRILMHEKGRNALAVGGIFIAVLMIFLQLGFYFSVPKGGMRVYDRLWFDLLLTSSAYDFQGRSYDFPRQRLYQAMSLPEVESAMPFYQSAASWLNPEDGLRRDVFVMGFRPADEIFKVDEIERQLDVIRRPNTVLVDRATLPMFGPQTRGRLIEIGEHTFEIGGQYELGTGFIGLGVVVTSDSNFKRMFPKRSLGVVNLGLIKLKPGSKPDQVALRLREILPADTKVFTRPEIESNEVQHWSTRTATGIIFGFGVVVSIVAGMAILYQTLATQVTRQLPQYATLKAIGYTDAYLRNIVLVLAAVMASVAFAPALAAATVIYDRVRITARLPIEMTGARVLGVLVLALAMSAASAFIAVRILRRADPADLF